MATYLINHLRIPGGIPTQDALAYLEQVEATVTPYGGKWLAIDAQVQVIEGAWPGSAVLMEFPDMAKAREWYESADYRKILPLRTTNSISDLILVDGVGPGFTTAGYAQQVRATLAGAPGSGGDPASHRRARQAADLLLLPEPERAGARTTLAYYNQVGDPSV
jgi:uncharacterized protein (DUF1330 family)